MFHSTYSPSVYPGGDGISKNESHNNEYHLNSIENDLNGRQSKRLNLSRLMLKAVKLRRGNYYMIPEFTFFILPH